MHHRHNTRRACTPPQYCTELIYQWNGNVRAPSIHDLTWTMLSTCTCKKRKKDSEHCKNLWIAFYHGSFTICKQTNKQTNKQKTRLIMSHRTLSYNRRAFEFPGRWPLSLNDQYPMSQRTILSVLWPTITFEWLIWYSSIIMHKTMS